MVILRVFGRDVRLVVGTVKLLDAPQKILVGNRGAQGAEISALF